MSTEPHASTAAPAEPVVASEHGLPIVMLLLVVLGVGAMLLTS